MFKESESCRTQRRWLELGPQGEQVSTEEEMVIGVSGTPGLCGEAHVRAVWSPEESFRPE